MGRGDEAADKGGEVGGVRNFDTNRSNGSNAEVIDIMFGCVWGIWLGEGWWRSWGKWCVHGRTRVYQGPR